MRKKISLILPLLCAPLTFLACGDSNSGTSANGGSIVSVNNKSIVGVSQKGPFVTGSAVKLYELDGETYAQTGKSFTGKITSDKGEFSVPSVTLASQYALLEASGYYRNEVSGEKSRGPITLNALTDLSDREKVNINLLTHLEYERALYLVGTGMSVSAAKKQAEMEIFNAFGIQGDFVNSEDLDIFSKGEGNAALLAISVMMQGSRSEAELTEFLTEFATDIEKDGEWNDEFAKAKVADWASGWSRRLSSIRSNINSWGLDTVPDFEKYVHNFWNKVYGLGECGDANVKQVVADSNSFSENYYSNSFKRYICKSNVWVEAKEIEKDTYQWAAGEDGEMKLGSVTAKAYKYDEASNRWVEADSSDVKIKPIGCTTNRTGEIGKNAEVYYVCRNGKWQVAEEIDYDTYGEKCSKDEVGKIISGKEIATNRYCCSSKGWVKITDDWSWDVPKEARFNPEIEYGSIIDDRDGQTYKTVKIGDQVWMAENLNYADSIKTPSLKGKSWCYNNKAENCDVAGRLYTWAAAIDSVALANAADNPQICGNDKTCTLPTVVQGVCPDGWHLPTHGEWKTLFAAVGSGIERCETSCIGIADEVLRTGSGWYNEDYGDNNGTDAYGFSALPAGLGSNGYFYDAGYAAEFWFASQAQDEAYAVRFDYEGANLLRRSKDYRISIRCLQDSN